MKKKYLNITLFICIILAFSITGFMLFSYNKIQNDLYDKQYYSNYQRYTENPAYQVIDFNIKSIDKDIPNYVSNNLLATNENYDRIVLDNGQTYLVKNRTCSLIDNKQKISVVINKHNLKEAYLYPQKQENNINAFLYFGAKYKNYISQSQIIKDCSAIPAN